MNANIFLMTMKHFIEYSKSTPQNKTLRLIEYHEAHNSTEANNLEKDNGVVLFTIPPHCINKLQPLDKAFRPLKRFHNEHTGLGLCPIQEKG